MFDVAADGSLSNARIFASGIRSSLEPGVPDGMKCDARGNVWVTAPGGVWVYAPSGDLLGKVRVPETGRQSRLGRRGLPHAVHDRHPFGLHGHDQGRPAQRALYERARRSERGRSAGMTHPSAPPRPTGGPAHDPRRCAMIIQDLQNDVISDGGAFADSGSPAHARAQHVVENVRRLADAVRARGGWSSMSGSSSSRARRA